MSEFESYYAILGLELGAAPEQIKRAYRSLARQWHPDRFPDPIKKAEAEAKIKQINLAYEKLKNYSPPEPSLTPPRSQATADQKPKTKNQKPSQQSPPETVGKNPYQLYQMASTQAKVGQYEQAITYLSYAIQLQPNFATAYRYRGWLRSILQLNRAAAADLAKAKTLEQQQSVQRPRSNHAIPNPPNAPSWPIVTNLATDLGGITVLALRYSRNLLISASRTGRLNLWDFKTGRSIFQVAAHTGKVTGLVLSLSGRILISSGADGLIKIWRLKSNRGWQSAGLYLRQSIEAHSSAINAIVLNHQTLLSAGEDGLIKIWQIPSGKCLDRLNLHGWAVQTLAISLDINASTWVASGDSDGHLKLWQFSQPGSIRTIQNPTGAIAAVKFHPNGQVIAWGDWFGWIYIASLDGQILQTIPAHQGAITDLNFSPCSRWLATAGQDRQVRVWDPTSGKIPLNTIEATMGTSQLINNPNQGSIRSLFFTPDSKKLITGGDELFVQIWQSPISNPD